MSKQLFICVDGVLIKDAKILLLKRSVEPFKGFWHVVGGHVEDNETFKEALKREFKEETNLDVQIGDELDRRIEETFDRIKFVVVLQVNSYSGRLKLNEESIEYGWFSQMPTKSVYDYSRYLSKPKNTTNFFP